MSEGFLEMKNMGVSKIKIAFFVGIVLFIGYIVLIVSHICSDKTKLVWILMSLLLFMIIVFYFNRRAFLKQTTKLEETNRLLYNKAILDELTGLNNYRYFLENLSMIWQKAMLDHTEVSLAMIDIDFFKKYNDCYGHQRGNECVSQISNIIKKETYLKDAFVARYGGEEFVIVMPKTNATVAKKQVEQIRRVIEETNIEHKDSELFRYVTISAGVSTMIPNENVSFEKIVKKADYVLYEAKKQGRNLVLEENDIDTSEHIRKSDGRFMFSKEQKEAYERLILPMGVFQVVENKVITLLVSDGLCELTGAGRLELTRHYDSNMLGNVHPDDRENLSKVGEIFAQEKGDYDVIYRTKLFSETYHKLHVVGKFQTVGENARVAFLVYTELKMEDINEEKCE